jgi:two-component system, sensor histidine kinase and response regulator
MGIGFMNLPASTEHRAVCDLRAALVRLDGDEELLGMLVAVFHEDAPRLLAELDRGLAAADMRAVERAAHSLKGLAANFDGISARDAALGVELLARNHESSGLAGAAAQLRREVVQLRDHLAAAWPS